MTIQEFKTLFLDMTSSQKTRVLSLISHNLTVCARAGSLPEVQDDSARQKLLAINELLHIITGQLMNSLDNDERGYPNDVFMDILLEMAISKRCECEIAQAIDWSYSSIRFRGGHAT